MSQQYPASWKQCATCAFWTGARETNYFGERVTVESPMAKGKCMCRGSGWFNQERQANFSCQRFEKWPCLK
jgi:hypothetical protein